MLRGGGLRVTVHELLADIGVAIFEEDLVGFVCSVSVLCFDGGHSSERFLILGFKDKKKNRLYKPSVHNRPGHYPVCFIVSNYLIDLILEIRRLIVCSFSVFVLVFGF